MPRSRTTRSRAATKAEPSRWRRTKRSRTTVPVLKRARSRRAPRKRAKPARAAPEEATPQEPATPSDPVTAARTVLETSHAPGCVVGRESELKTIRGFVSRCIEAGQGDSIYICGSPGTGKSLCVDSVCTALCGRAVQRIDINAMVLTRPQDIYKQILSRIDPGRVPANDSPLASAEALRGCFFGGSRRGKGNCMTVCVIDEIDALLSRAQTVLYRLFEWPKQAGSSLILIGISNNIDLTDRFLPRLRARACEPRLLVFEPYSHPQLRTILNARLRTATPEGLDQESSQPQVFDKMALELCARKVAAVSGDLRKCLDICKQCLDRAIAKRQGAEPSGAGDSGAPIRVGLVAMSRTLRSSLGSAHLDRIRALPMQKLLLLCALAVYFRIERKDVEVGAFQRWLKRLAAGQLTVRSTMLSTFNPTGLEFIDLLTGLAGAGLVVLSKPKKRGGFVTRKARLAARLADIKLAVQETEKLARLFEDDEVDDDAPCGPGPTMML